MTAPAVGILHQMWERHDGDEADFYARVVAEAEVADRVGFASMWMGEDHYRQDGRPFYGRVPAPELLIAHLAARTERIRFGTGVKVVPLVDPERIVEQMTMLHLITGGRVEFGLGQGTPNAPVTIADKARKSQLFRDRMARILDLLALGPVSTDGHVISPAPVPEIAERIWIASRDEAAVAFAASHDLGFVVGQAEVPVLQRGIVDTYRAHGGHGEVRGIRLVHVAETRAEALDRVRESAALYWSGMKNGPYHPAAVEAGLLPAGEPDDVDGLLERTMFIVGDPEQVREALLEHRRVTGVDRVDVMLQLPLLSTEAVTDTMTLFMDEVAPGLAEPVPA